MYRIGKHMTNPLLCPDIRMDEILAGKKFGVIFDVSIIKYV